MKKGTRELEYKVQLIVTEEVGEKQIKVRDIRIKHAEMRLGDWVEVSPNRIAFVLSKAKKISVVGA